LLNAEKFSIKTSEGVMAKRTRGKPTWQPTPEDFVQVFTEQNPWHTTGKVPDVWAQAVERPLSKYLWERLVANEPRRFELILGPRRVGKTTCMYQTVRRLLKEGIHPKRLWWLRLDHPLLMQIDLGTLVKLISSLSVNAENPHFLFLDELNYSGEWDLWLKTFYDETFPLRIAGTSSSTAALCDRRMESGVGRWEERYLAPYLFSEYLELINEHRDIPEGDTLFDALLACINGTINTEGLAERRRRFMLIGGFPELLLTGHASLPQDEGSVLLQSQRILRNDAVERAIYKDIPQVLGVDDPMLLERLLYTLAGQLAGLLSPNNICSQLDGLSQPTFDRYLSYLEKAFVVFTLPNYSGNETSVQKRGRKLYFVDGTIRNAALQRGVAPLSNETEMGLLIENMVAGHLHALSQQTQTRLYHWRDKDDEVDLIYDHPDKPMAFEIGKANSRHRRGLYTFVSRYPRFEGRCFIVSPEAPARAPTPASLDEIGSIPLDLFLLAISAQAEKELKKNLHPLSKKAGQADG
jgi:predicted AAA+ superfamily ATPase